MQNAGLDESQDGIKIAGRIISNLRYANDTTFKAENEEKLKNLLMKVKGESEKTVLKLNIQKTKIMASGPITSWQTDGKLETVTDFLFLGSRITAGGDCSHEIRRCLLLGWKAMANLDSTHIKKQRHYFANKGPSNQGYGFSSSHVWMWELDHKECWALKNWRFWNVVLEKTLESPLDCKEIQPVHPKGLKAGGEWDDRGWDGRMASPTQWTWVWVSSRSWWWIGKPGVLQSMGLQRVGHKWASELKWTEIFHWPEQVRWPSPHSKEWRD